MMKTPILVLLTMYASLVFSDEFIEHDFREGFYEADAYARAVKIDVLLSNNKNELRLWVEDGVSGGITGYVLTGSTNTICTSSLHTKEPNLYVIKSGSCKKSKAKSKKSNLNSVLERMSAYDNKKIQCNVMDGWSGILEGVFNGKRFSISLYNPDSCDEPDAVAITKLLSELQL